MTAWEDVTARFGPTAGVRERRTGLFQLNLPVYHEDGDMVEVYLQEVGGGDVLITDLASTVMRLSYDIELDTPNKKRIFQKIVAENGLEEANGTLTLKAPRDRLYEAVLQFSHGLAKVGSMRHLRREIVASLFLEELESFVTMSLLEFEPAKDYSPIPDRDDLQVDYAFMGTRIPVYLFAVKDVQRARLATIAMLEFQRASIRSLGIAVHEDFEALPDKDQTRITSAADKQFTSLADFIQNAPRYLALEAGN